MRYLSVCAGIEAATCAWHHMSWEPAGFSEIEKFPSQVLDHHYPNVPKLGDMTKYKEWEIGAIDLLVGGTPCQSFSVAGLRKGLEDPRGNLALVYCGILDHFRPKWFVWENVPGVLSSNGGRDFGSFLGALAQLGYGFAYRVLDAQFFGVAQRRKRVFVVGYLGDWRPAAAVLFESESLRRDSQEGREKRKAIAASAASGVDANGLQRTVGTLCADTHPGAYSGQDAYTGRLVPSVVGALDCRLGAQRAQNAQAGHMIPVGVASTFPTLLSSTTGVSRTGNAVTEHETYIPMVGCLGGQHPNAAIDTEKSPTLTNAMGSGGGHVQLVNQAVAQPIAFHATQDPISGSVSPALGSNMYAGVAQPISIQGNLIGREAGGPQKVGASDEGVMYTLTKADVHGVAQRMAVRRLTPVECERLQGFPDNYTNIKENCPDGPRYKALGNSMAVPVMRWIGERINAVGGAK